MASLSTEPQGWTAEEAACACEGTLHPQALLGIRLFNAGDYFNAHEELELAWREERGPVRDVYRGVLQVGLGYYHILRLNYPGAVKMFQRCQPWLAPFPAVCRGIDLGRLRADVEAAERSLLRLGPARLANFDPGLLKPVCLVNSDEDEGAG
jgi:predicted metal-dependent hydrolase